MEQARLARAAEHKRKIWAKGYDQRHRQLVTIERRVRDKGSLSQELMDATQAILEWMRERFFASRNTLGETHAVTRDIQADWRNTLGETRATPDHILKTDQEAEQGLIQKPSFLEKMPPTLFFTAKHPVRNWQSF